MLTYSEKPPFKENQWQHFLNSLIGTEKLAQQAYIYEKWKGIERAVYSEIAINPYAYERIFGKAQNSYIQTIFPKLHEIKPFADVERIHWNTGWNKF